MERRGGALPLRVGALAGAEIETRFLDADDDMFDLNLLRYYFANSPVVSVEFISSMIISCVQITVLLFERLFIRIYFNSSGQYQDR
jgi:hypothetical protein